MTWSFHSVLYIRKTQGPSRQLAVFLALALVFLLAGCGRTRNLSKEPAYINAPQTNLRDRLAPMYERKGIVKNGEKVWVLEKRLRFVRVRSERGEEGWVEERYLLDQDGFNGFQHLAADNANTPVQAHGVARASLNLHLAPGRDSEHLYQVKDGEKLEVLKRATAERNPATPRPSNGTGEPKTAALTGVPVQGGAKLRVAEEKQEPAREDWLLVRDSSKHTGWALGRMVDIDAPLEIAQYAEGQRIVASFVLNQVLDQGKQVPQYLLLLSENKDGLPWDYSQLRVFTWNLRRHRYETAYRERNLDGVFPVSVSTGNFGSDGVLPVFTIRVRNQDGRTLDRKYRLLGPLVRRVLSPEEEARKVTVAMRSPASTRRRQQR